MPEAVLWPGPLALAQDWPLHSENRKWAATLSALKWKRHLQRPRAKLCPGVGRGMVNWGWVERAAG